MILLWIVTYPRPLRSSVGKVGSNGRTLSRNMVANVGSMTSSQNSQIDSVSQKQLETFRGLELMDLTGKL